MESPLEVLSRAATMVQDNAGGKLKDILYSKLIFEIRLLLPLGQYRTERGNTEINQIVAVQRCRLRRSSQKHTSFASTTLYG